jgi:hypothetical protein
MLGGSRLAVAGPGLYFPALDTFLLAPDRAMPVTSQTPVTFSREDLKTIRHTLDSQETSLACPRCGGALQVQGGVASSGYQMLHVRCGPCFRVAFVGELPGRRWTIPDK